MYILVPAEPKAIFKHAELGMTATGRGGGVEMITPEGSAEALLCSRHFFFTLHFVNERGFLMIEPLEDVVFLEKQDITIDEEPDKHGNRIPGKATYRHLQEGAC